MSTGPTFGPYPTSGVLGSGGMGVVYLARDPKLGRELAIKTLTRGAKADETKRRRFQREARALAELSHPGLVTVVDAGVQDGVPWLAMLRVPGVTLEEQLRNQGPLSSEAVCDLGVQLCSALAVAHGRGILHRDLKPENVLVTKDGRYVITDFGLTKDLAGEVSGDLSKTGALIGTPGYWAPEQAMGRSSEASFETDVYGVGAVLYAALTGVPPISAPSLLEAVVATQERPPQPPSSLVSVSAGLEGVVLKCLEKSPEDRYDSVDVLEEALRELGREQASSAGGRKALLWAGAALAFLSGVGGVLLLGEGPGGPALASATPSPSPSAAPQPDPSVPTPRSGSQSSPSADRTPQGAQDSGRGAALEESWQRFLRLRDEVEERGSGDEAWHARLGMARELADATARELAKSPEGIWARGVAALTRSLKDPFADGVASPSQRRRWDADLRRALAGAVRKERQLALRAALAQSALRVAFEGRGAGSVQEARAEIASWESAGGARWRVLLTRARLELAAGQDPQALINACGALESEAERLERPWLRSAINFFRGELTHGFARLDHANLWRSLAADLNCPPILRGHAANRLAATLLEAGEPAEALTVLSQAPAPPVSVGERVRVDRGIIRAWAQVRARRSKLALETIAGLPPVARGLTRARLLRAIALAHEGRLDEARAVRIGLDDPEVALHRELAVEFVALAAPPERIPGLIQQILRKSRSLEVLVCADRLERLSSTERPDETSLVKGPALIRRLVDELRRPYAARIVEIVEDHLHAGLWSLAARRIEQLSSGPVDPELRVRLHYRALVRALEEVRPTDVTFQALHRRAVHLAGTELDRSRPHQRALMGALATLGPAPANVDLKVLQAGANARPQWYELHESAERVLSARRRLSRASPDLPFAAHRLIRHWLVNQPTSTRGRLARARWSPPEVVLEVFRGHKSSEARLVPLVSAYTERARFEAGEAPPRQVWEGLDLAGHSRLLLTRQRAEVLLDLAELRLAALGREREALLALELIQSWCGGELGDPARYHLARARALLGLGRGPEALPAARRALAQAPEADPPLRAKALAVLGQAEVAAGVAGGAERLREALELAPSFATWLAQARSTTGAEAEEAYAEVLSRPQVVAQIKPTWGEVLERKLDAERVGRLALWHYGGRGKVALRLLTTLALFLRQPTRGSATLFCRAMAQVWLSKGRARGLDPPEVRAHYQRALKLVEPRLRDLIEAIAQTLGALSAAQGAPRHEAAAKLAAVLAQLGRASQQVSQQEASDFWLPALRERCLPALSRLLDERSFQEVAREALEEARALRGVKRPSLRLEFWIGRLETRLRDPRAIATLDRAQARVAKYPELRRMVLLERGLLLRRLGRNAEALEVYRHVVRETDAPEWQVVGLTLSAQIQRDLGPEGRREQRNALARADSLGHYGVPPYVQKLNGMALVQLHLDSGDLDKARSALQEVHKRYASVSSGAIRGEEALLAATLARKEGDPARALQILSGVASTDEGASGLVLERARVLVALDRRGEARSFLRGQLEENKSLWPVERAPLRALLEELEGD